jgi:hypothetical protein
VSDRDDQHDEAAVVHLVDDPPVTYPQPQGTWATDEQSRHGSRINAQPSHGQHQSLLDGFVELAQLSGCSQQPLDLLGHASPSAATSSAIGMGLPPSTSTRVVNRDR